jgi:hypothetical protein
VAAETRLGRCSPELRRVFCTFHDGVLTLAGSVPTSYLRQIAPAVVVGIADVKDINNEIVVVAENRSGSLKNRVAEYFLQHGRCENRGRRPRLHTANKDLRFSIEGSC